MSLTLNEIVSMANANTEFIPGMSSNELFFCGSTDDRLTDVIADVAEEVLGKADTDHTHTGYAAANHTHSGYAASTHTHTPAYIGAATEDHVHSEYADVDHSHDGYAESIHSHTEYADSDHTHTPESIGAAAASHTHSEYAASTHAHSGYANVDHTHTPASIGAATVDHTHDYAASNHGHSYNDLSDKPSIPEAYVHPASHPATMITGLADVATSGSYNDLTDKPAIPTIPASLPANGGNADTVDGKHASDFATASHSHNYAASSHTHAQTDITGLADALSAKANVSDMSAKADLVNGKIPTSQLPAYVDDVLEYAALANFPTTGETGKIYVATGTNKTYRWSGSAYVEISASVALGETSATAYRGDRGKIAYDHSQNGAVHVTAAQKTAWDSKAAGDHSHSYNDLSDKPTIPAAYSHPASHPASMITGLADVATSGSYNDLSNKPTIPTIPASLPANGGNADTVDGKHASDFATASHKHDSAYMSKSLQFTADDGDAEVNLISGSGKNLLTELAALGKGMHTFYSAMGNAGNPKTTEAWRGIVFKTAVNYGFVQAYGSSGSTYSTYIDGGTWRGWKCQYDANPTPLWSGGYYMNSPNSNPQTVTPSKKLSECRTGWILLWSDYDVGGTINDSDFCTTMIPKYNPAGGIWNGKAFYCDIPMFVGSDANNLSTETRCIKPIYVHDDKLVGSYQNSSGGRNDVVLRAVYEF